MTLRERAEKAWRRLQPKVVEVVKRQPQLCYVADVPPVVQLLVTRVWDNWRANARIGDPSSVAHTVCLYGAEAEGTGWLPGFYSVTLCPTMVGWIGTAEEG